MIGACLRYSLDWGGRWSEPWLPGSFIRNRHRLDLPVLGICLVIGLALDTLWIKTGLLGLCQSLALGKCCASLDHAPVGRAGTGDQPFDERVSNTG